MPRYTLKGYGNGQRDGSTVYSGYNPNQEGGAKTRSTRRNKISAGEIAGTSGITTSFGKTKSKSNRGPWAFLKKQPRRIRNRSVETDLERFLKITGRVRKGNKRTLWHNALVPFQLHGANAGKIRNTNKAKMLLYALWEAFYKISRGQRDPQYSKILAGYDPMTITGPKPDRDPFTNRRVGYKRATKKSKNKMIVKLF